MILTLLEILKACRGGPAAGAKPVDIIRRAVLAQLLGVLGHMYNYLYTYLLSKPVTLVTSLRGCTEPENAETC